MAKMGRPKSENAKKKTLSMDIYAEATEEKKQESFERLAATLDIFDNKEGLLLSVLSGSKILPRTAN